MNKQELIAIIRTEVLLAKSSPERKGYIAGLEEAINIIEGFSNEPQKPVVPQFVADWYKKHKNSLEFSIFDYVYQFDRNEESDFKNWFNDINTKPLQTLVNMHQFGYTVEEEKRYTVKITKTDQYLYSRDNDFFFVTYVRPDDNPHNCHTRTELEGAGFGWIFSCEGIEVEEVE